MQDTIDKGPESYIARFMSHVRKFLEFITLPYTSSNAAGSAKIDTSKANNSKDKVYESKRESREDIIATREMAGDRDEEDSPGEDQLKEVVVLGAKPVVPRSP
jgi:hypothetical protein